MFSEEFMSRLQEAETEMFQRAQTAVRAAMSGQPVRVEWTPPGCGGPLTMTPRDGVETLELTALHSDQAPLRERALAAIAAASATDHPGACRVAGAARAALKRLSDRSMIVTPVA